MARTALEIFLVDQTNYFLNFPSKKVGVSCMVISNQSDFRLWSHDSLTESLKGVQKYPGS